MPKGAKKRAKLKKKQQQEGHPDHGGNNNNSAHHDGSGSDNNNSNSDSGRRDRNVRIPSHVDASEDSMESSEEMVTPRAAGSEADDEDRKAAVDVHVERGVHEAQAEAEAGEEVMVDALQPETSGQVRQGKDEEEVEVHAVVQEPEVKDVVVDESPPAVQEQPEVAPVVDVPEVAPVVEVPEVNREVEVAKLHPVHEPQQHEPEHKVDDAATVLVGETPPPPAVHEPEVKGGNVVVKDSTEASRSRDVDVHTAEARGPAVAVAASAHRATWWNCCGLFDAFSGSER